MKLVISSILCLSQCQSPAYLIALDHKMKRKDAKKKSIARPSHRGSRARAGGHPLRTCTIGVLPIVNQLLDRMQLESFFKQHLRRDSQRMAIPTSRCLLLLLRNTTQNRLGKRLGVQLIRVLKTTENMKSIDKALELQRELGHGAVMQARYVSKA